MYVCVHSCTDICTCIYVDAGKRKGAGVREGGGGMLTGDGADVDNVPPAAVGPGEEDGQDGLRHVDEAGDVCPEHDGHVLRVDVRRPGHATDEAAVDAVTPVSSSNSFPFYKLDKIYIYIYI